MNYDPDFDSEYWIAQLKKRHMPIDFYKVSRKEILESAYSLFLHCKKEQEHQEKKWDEFVKNGPSPLKLKSELSPSERELMEAYGFELY